MRSWAAWAIPWLLAVCLSALSTQGSSAQEDNLLINGGFEEADSEQRPPYWLAHGGELKTDNTLVRSGSYSGKFVADPGSRRGSVKQCVPVAPSSDYEFWGYAATEVDASVTVYLNISWHTTDNCSQEIGDPWGGGRTALDKGSQWYELAMSASSLSSARSALVTIVVEVSPATVYLDDFSVTGPAAPAETPTPEPSASPSPSPTRTVGPHGTPAPTATAHQRTPVPAATPAVSSTASSQQMTPVPAPSGALRNGSFEEADSEGRPSSWSKYGGELLRTSAARFEGQFAAALRSETSSTKWAYQTVTVQGGKAYILSGYSLKDDPAVAAAYLRLSWYASPDGSGQAIDSADSTEHLTDDSLEFRLLTTGAVVAPAEAASAKARLMLDPVDEAPAAVYFDAVTFEETALPEPTLSPTAAPPPDDDEETFTPSLPATGESTPTPASGPRSVPTSADSRTRPRSSPTAAGNSTPAVLGATLAPFAATTTVAPTSTRAPATVYRERKSNLSVRYGATARQESGGGGLSALLLALAAGVPALIGAGIGVSYWRWRRARLR
jgi:hypothetical protein